MFFLILLATLLFRSEGASVSDLKQSTIPGGQCATIHGTTLMQPSFANNWDMHILAVSVLCLSVIPTVYLVIVVYFRS